MELLDQKILAGIRKLEYPGENSLLVELVETYLSDMQANLAGLRTAVKQKNTAEINRIAHFLKGSSGNIGACRLAVLFNQIEKTSAIGADQSTTQLMLEIEAAFPLTESALLEELKKQF